MHTRKFFSYSLFSTFIFVLSVTSIQAKSERFPHGCRELGSKISNDLLILENAAEEHPQTLYLIHNIYGGPVILKRLKTHDKDLGPLYKNKLGYNEWGAFAMDKQIMHFACYTGDGDLQQQVNCGQAIDICQYTRAKFGEGNMGNYWSVKSTDLYNAKRQAIQQGILLRW